MTFIEKGYKAFKDPLNVTNTKNPFYKNPSVEKRAVKFEIAGLDRKLAFTVGNITHTLIRHFWVQGTPFESSVFLLDVPNGSRFMAIIKDVLESKSSIIE